MHNLKTKFVPLFVVLAIVLCGTWALAANGVFDTSAAAAAEPVSEPVIESSDEDNTDNANYTKALEIQQAMTQLEDATSQLNAITEASAGTGIYYWMCYGDTVGDSLDTMNALIARYSEICERVTSSLALVAFYDRTCDTPEYAAYTLSASKAQSSVDAMGTLVTELETMFSSYDPYTCSVEYAGDYKLTGYCGCVLCCGIYGCAEGEAAHTASGTIATEGRTIAMSNDYAFGTVVYIDGLGFRTVEDRGGAVSGNKIDVYMESHNSCFSSACNRVATTYIINFSE